ncbi:uncharacterized protein LOC142234836 [Haematobia irritans]|uniref:uncharacterized protein LOC142234836 n=1 Tax=Haematobia irritans TaxID=7368 RepID=UPI003F4FC1BE
MSLVRPLIVIATLNYVTSVFGGLDGGRNLSHFVEHRQKRGLIFQNGGIAKLVMGPIFPIDFGDPINWRALICLVNIHVGEFKVPDSPLYPWDKWENIYARTQSSDNNWKPDDSREFIYHVLEYFMERTHGSGRECLLRSICENAHVDHHMDLFGDILNAILTPGKEILDPVYREAYKYGKNGIDCFQYYTSCPKGLNFLDQFINEN